MTQPSSPLAGVVRHARHTLNRRGPQPLVRALRRLDKTPVERATADLVWLVAGLGWAFAETLNRAHSTAGRAVVELIFTLHARLGHGAPPAQTDARLNASLARLKPYEPWIEEYVGSGSLWRPVLIRWVDILSERLTMHRYGDAGRRRLHAEALLAVPLRLIFGLDTEPERLKGTAQQEALTAFCEQVLAFWDLTRAETQSSLGWNRIEPPAADQIGGFVGLADEARPPTPETVRRTAGEMAAAIQAAPSPRPDESLDAWLDDLSVQMQAALKQYAATGYWPPGIGPADGGGMWNRFRDLFRG